MTFGQGHEPLPEGYGLRYGVLSLPAHKPVTLPYQIRGVGTADFARFQEPSGGIL